ncbi:ion transporter [Alterinioella nitratireducens]|uniref:ion transporter n=1 Tax=Alterinioella nitratireducens TaxID=2735915 RepID=UPI001553C0E0|nr:ion transporter [Alterinioella nitratireducens]NPD19448.1 ion transporter [Alterinioella nitratireducens]
MTRSDVLHILDGTGPRFGKSVALALNGLILLSAATIAVETMPGLPAPLRSALFWLEVAILAIFAVEYMVRVICAPRPWRYIFSFWGLVDLLAVLPALVLLQPQWASVRVFRLIRLVRLLKLFRTSLALNRMRRAVRSVRGELTVLGVMAAMVLYVAAVGIYIFEHQAQPEIFSSIPMALWWAVASLTTVGYGDMVPLTVGGRIFTTLVLFVGLGIVAGPAAIITAALLESDLEDAGLELSETHEDNDDNKGDVT